MATDSIQIIIEIAGILAEAQAARDEVAAVIGRGQGRWPRKGYVRNDQWHRLQGELWAYDQALLVLSRLVTVRAAQ